MRDPLNYDAPFTVMTDQLMVDVPTLLIIQKKDPTEMPFSGVGNEPIVIQ